MAIPVDDCNDAGSEMPRDFLVVFAHHNMYFNMRFQELESLALLLGLADSREELFGSHEAPTALEVSPLCRVRLRGGDAGARRLCERAVLIKAVLEVWAEGSSIEEAVSQALDGGPSAHAQRRHFLAPPLTFQIRVMAFGKTATMDDKRSTFELLRPLFDGDEVANLDSPDTTVWAIAEHQHHTDQKTHLGPRTGEPKRTFVGRQVAGGRSLDKKQKSGEKAYFHRYDLSQRAVLGPTTLDNELAFIMANCAQVTPGQVAMDPFCGTGGIMVALSHFGARVFGGEIDIRVVMGWRIAYTKNKEAALGAARQRSGAGTASASVKGMREDGCARSAQAAKPAALGSAPGLSYLVDIGLVPSTLLENGDSGQLAATASQENPRLTEADTGRDIFTNFIQYGLPLPEVVVCDNAVPPWRKVERGWCACIVTDPPYGVRAGAKKQGRVGEKAHREIQDLATYIPSKVGYEEEDLSRDLLTLAADALVDGGRLVFLVPVDLADFLGIDRAASERGGGPRASLHGTAMPKGGRVKDPRLCISETTRDPLLLDESRYLDFLPRHSELELVGASLQVLSGGLGRLLVTMHRRPRSSRS